MVLSGIHEEQQRKVLNSYQLFINQINVDHCDNWTRINGNTNAHC